MSRGLANSSKSQPLEDPGRIPGRLSSGPNRAADTRVQVLVQVGAESDRGSATVAGRHQAAGAASLIQSIDRKNGAGRAADEIGAGRRAVSLCLRPVQHQAGQCQRLDQKASHISRFYRFRPGLSRHSAEPEFVELLGNQVSPCPAAAGSGHRWTVTFLSVLHLCWPCLAAPQRPRPVPSLPQPFGGRRRETMPRPSRPATIRASDVGSGASVANSTSCRLLLCSTVML